MDVQLQLDTAVIHRKSMEKMGITPGSMEETVFLALAFAGEAGEIANLVKKMWRDGWTPEMQVELMKEMADCIIYMSHLLAANDTTEDEVVTLKLAELKARWPWVWNDALPQGGDMTRIDKEDGQ